MLASRKSWDGHLLCLAELIHHKSDLFFEDRNDSPVDHRARWLFNQLYPGVINIHGCCSLSLEVHKYLYRHQYIKVKMNIKLPFTPESLSQAPFVVPPPSPGHPIHLLLLLISAQFCILKNCEQWNNKRHPTLGLVPFTQHRRYEIHRCSRFYQ